MGNNSSSSSSSNSNQPVTMSTNRYQGIDALWTQFKDLSSRIPDDDEADTLDARLGGIQEKFAEELNNLKIGIVNLKRIVSKFDEEDLKTFGNLLYASRKEIDQQWKSCSTPFIKIRTIPSRT